MTIKEVNTGLAMLKVAYPQTLKTLTEEEIDLMINLWSDEFKNDNFKNFENAIRKIIKTNKFFPSIQEVRENMDKNIDGNFMKIIELMKQDGYFSNANEVDKILMWYDKGIIPSWFKEDMQKYKQNTIEYKPTKEQLEEIRRIV